MAVRTISNAGGNFNAVGAWVEGIVPTSNDDIYATATSGNLTINTTSYCRSIDLTNYHGLITSANLYLCVGAATYRPDLVAINIPDGTNYTNLWLQPYSSTNTQLTMYIADKYTAGVPEIYMTTFSGNYKMLSTLAVNRLQVYASNGSCPININMNGHDLVFSSELSLSFSGAILDCTGSKVTCYYTSSVTLTQYVNTTWILDNATVYLNCTSITIQSQTATKALTGTWIIGGTAGTVTIGSNLTLTSLSIIATAGKTITISSGLILKILNSFTCTPKMTITIQSSGANSIISKASGLVEFYNVSLNNITCQGGATFNALNNCSTFGTASGLNLIGGSFCIDYINGDDSLTDAYSWWKVTYTNATGTCPSSNDTITGSTSGAIAKLSNPINTVDWLLGSGTLYLYGKVGTFISETVTLSTGGSFHISGDLQNSAWKTITNGALTSRISSYDELHIVESPGATSLGQNALWTSTPDIGGTAYTQTSISSSTNATPIVITRNPHGLVTGDFIQVFGHLVNTNANGNWYVTVINSSTFSLNGSVGNGIGAASGNFAKINNRVVVLDTPVTTEICDCNTVWTAGTNVTTTLNITDFKFSAGCIQIATNASCGANQILAKFALPSAIDLSNRQQISFWFKLMTSVIAAGNLLIKLYSDSACTVEVESFDIGAQIATSSWWPVTVDKGSFMSATVRGVALYTTIAQPSKTFYIDNIIACKAANAPDSLTLQSLISKNIANDHGDEVFVGLQGIKDRYLFLDNYTNTIAGRGKGYCGITESVTLYKRETIKTAQITQYASAITLSKVGLVTKLLQVIGGWNKITNVRTGTTMFDGLNCWGYGFYSGTYLKLIGLQFTRYYYGIRDISYSTFVDDVCTNTFYDGFYLTNQSIDVIHCRCMFNNSGFYLQSAFNSMSDCISNNNITYGFNSLASVGPWDAIADNNATGIQINNQGQLRGVVKRTNYNSTYGIYINSGTPTVICDEITECSYNAYGLYIYGTNGQYKLIKKLNNNGNYAIYFVGYGNTVNEITEASNNLNYLIRVDNTDNMIKKIVTANNNVKLLSTGFNGDRFYLYNSTFTNFTGGPALYNVQSFVYLIDCIGLTEVAGIGSVWYKNAKIFCHNFNTRGVHKTFCEGGLIYSDTTVRHTDTGISWKISINSVLRTITFPLDLSIAKIQCNAEKTVRIGIWVNKTHATDIAGRLFVSGYKIAGIPYDTYADTAQVTGWQNIYIDVTPTYADVIEVIFYTYWVSGLADESLYIDDLSITELA